MTMNPEVIAFVNSMMIGNHEEATKIDLTEATYNMCQWLTDDVEMPEGMTPEELMIVWNWAIECEEESNNDNP